ncbi:hypothetical protein ABZ078_29310 [Streptomyces sp. NPDC006385]|uniref:hypothetical protein n=1 Tax=Streptomyces sp. NPDC006385 TaxID=3156761 RepID=UPI0033B860B6
MTSAAPPIRSVGVTPLRERTKRGYQDGTLITGQDPQPGKDTAERVLRALAD